LKYTKSINNINKKKRKEKKRNKTKQNKMSKQIVMIPGEVDVGKLHYSDPKSMPNGGKIAYINYGDGIDSISIQTPQVSFPFNATFYPDEHGGKFSCVFSLKSNETDEKEFIEKMNEIDEKIKNDAKINSQAWFKKKSITDDALDEKYKPIVKYSVDEETGEKSGKYPPTMKFKVVQRNDKFQCKFYDETKKRLNVDNAEETDFNDVSKLLAKGTTGRILLTCRGLWFTSAGFGSMWNAEQIKLKVPKVLEDYAFRDDDGEFVDESDDKEEEEEEEESESESGSDEPVKVVKRKK
jgi:hypothetical protein